MPRVGFLLLHDFCMKGTITHDGYYHSGIYGRMGCALVEKIGAREDCRIVAGVDRETGRIGEIPVYAGFDALPCKGVIIDFSSPAGAVAAAQYGAANGLPCVICSTGLSSEDEAALELPAPGRRSSAVQTCRWVSTC